VTSAVPLQILKKFGKPEREFLAVRQTRQGIVACLVVDGGGHAFEFADIPESQYIAFSLVLHLVDFRDGPIDGEGLAMTALHNRIPEKHGMIPGGQAVGDE